MNKVRKATQLVSALDKGDTSGDTPKIATKGCGNMGPIRKPKIDLKRPKFHKFRA